MTDAKTKIQKARVGLVLDQPFFGSLILRLPCKPDPTCPTAWTDGKSLGYNPQFIDTLSLAQTQGLLCHEVLHCSNGHPWRKDAREHDLWNQAADYAINPIVSSIPRIELPPDGLMDDRFTGSSAEAIYSTLSQEEQEGKRKKKPGPGFGEVRPPQPGDQSADAPGLEADWKVATLQAAQSAKKQGKLPAGLDRLIKEIKNPRVDWRSALRRFVQTACKDDYTWKLPNRRYLSAGLYLPSLYSESIPPIAVAIDTSGSIDDRLLEQFAGELNSIVDEMQPASVDVLYCDSEIAGTDHFDKGEPVTFDPKGGGGTDFRPVFTHLEEADTPPACLIYFTDLCGYFPDEPSSIPTLWASTSEGKTAPFGETLEIWTEQR